MQTNAFLKGIQSEIPEERFAAWRSAAEVDPKSIAELGRLAASENPGIAKAAREAITTMTHGSPRRGEVAKQLIALAARAALPVKAHAYRNLSLIATEADIPAIAKGLGDPQVREEAIFCLERIPGAASDKVLIAGYKSAPDEFRPRILYALGHRRAPDAVLLCVDAMRSANKEIAIAAVKAYGRIGVKPAAAPPLPDTAGMTEWQKIDRMDSLLRYADEQARKRDHAEALRVYRIALARPEEHWQCAAIIGIAKLGTPEAAAVIHPNLKSPHPKVRITARNAWKSMAL
jgi:HEAT repeat protein